MSKGEVKNPQTDQRVGNKSGNQGRNGSSSSSSSEYTKKDNER